MRAERAASPWPTVMDGTTAPSMPGIRAVTVTGWPSRTLVEPGVTWIAYEWGNRYEPATSTARAADGAKKKNATANTDAADRAANGGAPHAICA